ncbi:MAG: threonine-phosphate decarboxylase [Aliishimia sp.]
MTPDTPEARPDHGGNLDSACVQFGGTRDDWIDLSTGINPVAYSLGDIPYRSWTDLPDQKAQDALLTAARKFWSVPDTLDIVATHGASALIAAIPGIFLGKSVQISGPTYNEHALAFRGAGWDVKDAASGQDAKVLVHPNNPDGRLWSPQDLNCRQLVIDESFADCSPSDSLLHSMNGDDHITLKSFGKFWGLAGIRLGFAISSVKTIARLRMRLGPWSVSGPALSIGATALADQDWADQTRARLTQDAKRLDECLSKLGAQSVGGTTLFRLYDTQDAKSLQTQLAQHKIWSRVFPYNSRWLRLGLPAPADWPRLEALTNE